jgi:hypothetical protein
MPKRVVDGEALWQSSKLSQVLPLKYRGELANLLPLMSVNGSFEADARLIWAQVYGFNRPDVRLKDVEAMLKEFERVKILFRWKVGDNKVWGYFIGVEKSGRLPPPSKRYSDAASTDIPEDLLAAFAGVKVTAPYRRPTEAVSDRYTGSGIGLSDTIGLTSSPVNVGIESDTGINNLNTVTISSSTPTILDARNEATQIPIQQDASAEAKQLAIVFYQLVQDNPHFEYAPKEWENLWTSDFTTLLQDYSFEQSQQIVVTSQKGNWQKYIIRPMALLKMADEIWGQVEKISRASSANKHARFVPDPDDAQDELDDEFDRAKEDDDYSG